MIIAGPTFECSAASFNALHAWDAVVDASAGAASGSIYPTITAALAAGAKSILVRSGTYNESVIINSNYVRLVGERPPTTATACARINGSVILAGGVSYCEVGNLCVSGSSLGVVVGSCSHIYIHDVLAQLQTAGNGFLLALGNGNTKILLERCLAWGDGLTTNGGFVVTAAGAAATEWLDITFRDCWAYYQGGPGFSIEAEDTGLYTGLRTYVLENCTARHCARATAGHGFQIGRRPFVVLSHCRGFSNGVAGVTDSACGLQINVNDTTNTRTVRVSDGWFYNNRATGVNLSAASSRVILLGNHAHSNTANFGLATSSPGYAGNGLTAPGTNISG